MTASTNVNDIWASVSSSTSEFTIPVFDQQIINETNPNNIVITYKNLGITVATKTVSISGAITTITLS